MHASRLIRQAVLAVGMVVIGAGLQAQGQSTQKPFVPSSGQPGKDVVWVPTPQPLVNAMLDLAKVTPQDYVIDLGSGDGRTVITAAKRGAKALGIEYNPDMVELSQKNAAEAGVTSRATFMKADLFETDFSQATVVTLFLLPDINLRLRPKILDMKPGTRVVSNSFTMGEWEPDQEVEVKEDCTSWCKALFWVVPAKVAGTWKLPEGTLTLAQEFQKISGTIGTNKITDGKMNGDQITFTAGGVKYTGRVNGTSMQGTMTGGRGGSWNATRGTS